MSKPRVLIVGAGFGYAGMFVENGYDVVSDISDADLVQFTGGEDVHPSLYNHAIHPKTYTNSLRDVQEEALFRVAKSLGIPCAGICRGGQFLNVVNGGSMIQHVEGHAIGGTHPVYSTEEGFEEVACSSTHHQMMIPNSSGNVLGTANEGMLYEFIDDKGDITVVGSRSEPDTEVVFYEDTKSLCFQPHPEFFDKEHPCQKFYFHLINKYLLGE